MLGPYKEIKSYKEPKTHFFHLSSPKQTKIQGLENKHNTVQYSKGCNKQTCR